MPTQKTISPPDVERFVDTLKIALQPDTHVVVDVVKELNAVFRNRPKLSLVATLFALTVELEQVYRANNYMPEEQELIREAMRSLAATFLARLDGPESQLNRRISGRNT